jgi:hypothetical protein
LNHEKVEQLLNQLTAAIEKINRIEAILQAYEAERPDAFMTAKQLAAHLGRSERYVYRMKRAGFKMPGGLATPKSAIAFLLARPCKCRRDGVCQ